MASETVDVNSCSKSKHLLAASRLPTQFILTSVLNLAKFIQNVQYAIFLMSSGMPQDSESSRPRPKTENVGKTKIFLLNENMFYQ